ncbi:MAG: hypothetical protein AAF614_18595 [Chloroflexota bacterium]
MAKNRQAILALENERRAYQAAKATAGSLYQAIDRGYQSTQTWAEIQEHEQAAKEKAQAMLELARAHDLAGDGVVAAWIGLHLQTCLRLMEQAQGLEREETAVWLICLGEIIEAAGRFLGARREAFSVNTYFLPDYDTTFAAIVASGDVD